ncbi:MAG: Ig-like domain-containing protein [Planctomycetota bacterium]|nr:Ig-like domain-containing protein [Planctomycetota bacterium]
MGSVWKNFCDNLRRQRFLPTKRRRKRARRDLRPVGSEQLETRQLLTTLTIAPFGDATLDGLGHPEANLGGDSVLKLLNSTNASQQRSLVEFDLEATGLLPQEIGSATLEVYQIDTATTGVLDISLQAVGRDWVEGTGVLNDRPGDGASYTKATPGNPGVSWTTVGGDFNNSLDFGNGPNGIIATDTLTPTGAEQFHGYDVTNVVVGWLSGDLPNNGFGFVPNAGANLFQNYQFASSENANVSIHPRLVIETQAPTIPVIEIASTGLSVAEDAGSIDVTVSRIGDVSLPVTVDYGVSDGTATTGLDYAAVSGTLLFDIGETTKIISIPILDDGGDEVDETFSLLLSNLTQGVIRRTSNSITITDNDIPPTNPVVGTLVKDVSLDGLGDIHDPEANLGGMPFLQLGNNLNLLIDFDLPNVTIDPEDILSASLDLHRNSGNSLEVDLRAVGRDWVEGTGTVFNVPGNGASWLNAAAGDPWVTPGGDFESAFDFGQGANGIVSHTTLPDFTAAGFESLDVTGFAKAFYGGQFTDFFGFGLQVTQNNFNFNQFHSSEAGVDPSLLPKLIINEAEEQVFDVPTSLTAIEGDTLLVTVDRSGASTGSVSVDYTTTSGSAVDGSDFTGSSGTLVFAAGEVRKVVAIPIALDGIADSGESFTFNLSNASVRSVLGTATSNITVIESAGTLSIQPSVVTGDEDGGFANITVLRTGGRNGTVTVDVDTADGSAIAGSDYAATSTTLTFLDGETSKTFSVALLDDGVFELPETFSATLGNPTGGASIGNDTGTVLILDDDVTGPGLLSLVPFTLTVNESDGTANFEVVRSNGDDGTVTVDFTTAEGTALAGLDYTTTSGTLTFLDGETSKVISIPLIDDNLDEGGESLGVSIFNVTGGALLGNTTSTLTIAAHDENTRPVALNDTVGTGHNTAITISVLNNDFDPDGDFLTVVLDTLPSNGTVVVNPDRTITYTPNNGFAGQDSFKYFVDDGRGGTDDATVSVNVDPDNFTPNAADDSFFTPPNTAITINVLANDSDQDGDPLTVTIVTPPTDGTAVVNPDGTITYTPNTGFVGFDSLVYQISDGELTDTANVELAVGVNRAPTAINDSAVTQIDTPVIVNVLLNDGDPDGDSLTSSIDTQPANGNAVANLDGTVTYTPNPGYSGLDSFVYGIDDGNGGTDTGTVNVTIFAGNQAPVAVDDNVATPTEAHININVLANDDNPDLDPLTITILTPPTNGIAVVNPDNTIGYTPNTLFVGNDSFVYLLDDGNGGTDTATVNINVFVGNVAPTANVDFATTTENVPVTIDVLANDSDANGDSLTVSINTQPANGTAGVNLDDTITYVPNGGFSGIDSFTYLIDDGNGGTATATVSITVFSNNQAPVAGDDSASTLVDTSINIDVLANDFDPDNDLLTLSIDTQPTNGTVTIEADLTITYTPNAAFTGSDSFVYQLDDGNGGTDTASVIITVSAGNQDPIADNDAVSTAFETAVTVFVLANDSDPDGDPLAVSIATSPSDGSVVVNPDNSITYTPNAGFNGVDSFVYLVDDGIGGSDTASVEVTVGAPPNLAPDAVDDNATTPFETAVNIDVLANDSDPEGDSLTVTIDTAPTNGSVVVNPDGSITYTPNTGFEGADSFVYQVDDGNGNVDTATVNVTVEEQPNQAPDAVDDSVNVPFETAVIIDVLANDSDPDADTLTVSIDTSPTNGSVVVNLDGTITYTPDAGYEGPDSFVYQVDDGNGGTDTATVSVTVLPEPNQPPTAVFDGVITPFETPIVIDVLANDSDPDGDPLVVTIDTFPTSGTAVVNLDGTITYTPDAGFEGIDSFVYQIDDNEGGTDTAAVDVTVLPKPNEAPTAGDDSATTTIDTPAVIDVLANDSDPDGDFLTVTIDQQPSNGTVNVNGNGSITYTPGAGFEGLDSFVYRIDDGNGGSDTATVDISVSGFSPTPLLISVDTSANMSNKVLPGQNVTLSGTFFDPNSTDSLTVSIDWGDDTQSTVIVNAGDPQSFSETHQYATGGLFKAKVTVTDSTDLTSNELGTTSVVSGARLHNRVLEIIGTDADDNISTVMHNGKMKLTASFLAASEKFKLEDVDVIHSMLFAGNDFFGSGTDVPINMIIDAGTGNDHIFAGAGDDVLLGNDGHDYFLGSYGNDIIVGGNTNDTMYGGNTILDGNGEDILIGGRVDYESVEADDKLTDFEAWTALITEWSNTSTPVLDRIDNITNGVDGSYLRMGDNIHDDDWHDFVHGGFDTDWILIHDKDIVLEPDANDVVTNG